MELRGLRNRICLPAVTPSWEQSYVGQASLLAKPLKFVKRSFSLIRSLFKKCLELATLNSFFVFDSKFCKQVDGLGMGFPLGPTFAIIFMCHHEERLLENCPSSFKPVLYQAYGICSLILLHILYLQHEFQFLLAFLSSNGFPVKYADSPINKVVSNAPP